METKENKDRFYCGFNGQVWQVFGWNLEHEPTPDNESGYEQNVGVWDTLEEAKENCPTPNNIQW